jgi:hypothetical protein
VHDEQRSEYMCGIGKALAGDTDQLATLFLRGNVEQASSYRSGER